MKVCTKCAIVKKESEFSRDSMAKDGFTSICKTCKKEYVKKKSQGQSDFTLRVQKMVETQFRRKIESLRTKARVAHAQYRVIPSDKNWFKWEMSHALLSEFYNFALFNFDIQSGKKPVSLSRREF